MQGFIARWNKFLNTTMASTFEAFSLLAIRLVCGGGLALMHGWSKLNRFSEMSQVFPDPLHIGSPAISLSLTIFGELVCGLLVALGFCTRLFAFFPFFTMAVAVLIIHGSDPFEKKELALLYGVGFLALMLKGGGPLSIDGLLNKK